MRATKECSASPAFPTSSLSRLLTLCVWRPLCVRVMKRRGYVVTVPAPSEWLGAGHGCGPRLVHRGQLIAALAPSVHTSPELLLLHNDTPGCSGKAPACWNPSCMPRSLQWDLCRWGPLARHLGVPCMLPHCGRHAEKLQIVEKKGKKCVSLWEC